jgi:hypothetical protein
VACDTLGALVRHLMSAFLIGIAGPHSNFLDTLKMEGQITLQKMMLKSSEAARAALNLKDAPANKEQRYESERVHNNVPSSAAAVALVLKTFFNLIAADAAL